MYMHIYHSFAVILSCCIRVAGQSVCGMLRSYELLNSVFIIDFEFSNMSNC